MMREFGSERRLPFCPAPSKKAPIEAAVPKQTVFRSQGTYCIVSKMAMPAETEPPEYRGGREGMQWECEDGHAGRDGAA
eukprot:scaffold2000_cov86-Isochrysis_galbana.AAC.4